MLRSRSDSEETQEHLLFPVIFLTKDPREEFLQIHLPGPAPKLALCRAEAENGLRGFGASGQRGH